MSRPPAAIASAEGCASARPVVQPRPPARRMQPVGPGCCDSAPVVASRCRIATASASLAAAYSVGAVGRDRERVDAGERAAGRAHAPASRRRGCRPACRRAAAARHRSDRSRTRRRRRRPGRPRRGCGRRARSRARSRRAGRRPRRSRRGRPGARSRRRLELRQRAGLDVTREAGDGARDRRDGIQMAAVGRERDLRDAAQAERVAAAADRGGDAPERARRTGSARPSWRCAGSGDRRAAAGVEVAAVGAHGDGVRALEARSAGAAGGGDCAKQSCGVGTASASPAGPLRRARWRAARGSRAATR